jgi:glycosyltransferase involved in cell wall biosynthesis
VTISVIIFAYNEAVSLPTVATNVLNILTDKALQSELIIVDDGSSDNTPTVCSELTKMDKRCRIIRHNINKGIGAAIKSGYANARYEFVCAIPGDGQFDVEELRQIAPFPNNTFYSFYRPETNYSLYRSCLTWLNRILNQHLLGVLLRDVNWIKVYRKDQLEHVNPQLTSSLIESEICAKLYKEGVMPIEIPSKYLPRESGVSKGGSWKTLRLAIRDTLKLWWVVVRYSPRKGL